MSVLAIQRFYSDYCYLIDDGDGPGFAASSTPDGAVDGSGDDAI
jgi:hypothetical protein